MTERVCKCGCGSSLEGLDRRRVFINDTHRKRVARGSVTPPAAPTGPVVTVIADRLRAEFNTLNVLESYEAQTALGIAAQLDAKIVQGAAYVSLSKELDRRVDALRLKAERPNDPTRLILDRVEEKQAHLRAV